MYQSILRQLQLVSKLLVFIAIFTPIRAKYRAPLKKASLAEFFLMVTLVKDGLAGANASKLFLFSKKLDKNIKL